MITFGTPYTLNFPSISVFPKKREYLLEVLYLGDLEIRTRIEMKPFKDLFKSVETYIDACFFFFLSKSICFRISQLDRV